LQSQRSFDFRQLLLVVMVANSSQAVLRPASKSFFLSGRFETLVPSQSPSRHIVTVCNQIVRYQNIFKPRAMLGRLWAGEVEDDDITFEPLGPSLNIVVQRALVS